MIVRKSKARKVGRGVLTAPSRKSGPSRRQDTTIQSHDIEICILAGGLSTRMGRDKSRLRIGSRTMLQHVRAVADATELPVRIIRRDLVKRCGPLGGIITALKTSRARAVLFLACDMPLVSPRLLNRLLRASHGGARPVFAAQNQRSGFPFVIPVTCLACPEQQAVSGEFSVQKLAVALRASRLRIPARSHELFNVNTPEDVLLATEYLLAN